MVKGMHQEVIDIFNSKQVNAAKTYNNFKKS